MTELFRAHGFGRQRLACGYQQQCDAYTVMERLSMPQSQVRREALDTLATENGHYSNPNVVTAQDQAFGVLKLTLHPDSYSWDYRPALTGPGFDPATAMSYSDPGSAACRG